MTPGSVDSLESQAKSSAPSVGQAFSLPDLLILGIGNQLLSDDGAGLVLLEALQQEPLPGGGQAEFLDGGTQGLMLLNRIAGRPALLILDAVKLGAPPGTVHVLRDQEVLGLDPHHSRTVHEGNASELLAVAQLLGECPPRIGVVGIEPEHVGTGVGVSETVRGALSSAVLAARATIEELLAALTAPVVQSGE